MTRVQKLFSDDSGISQFAARMRHLITVNILWVLGCLPVFTAGAATAAALDSLRYTEKAERVRSGKMFLWAFRKHFRRASVLWAGLALLAVPFVVIFLLCQGKENIHPMLAALILFLLFLFDITLTMSFQVLVRSSGSVPEVLLFSLLAGMRYLLPYTLPVMILSSLPVLMFFFAPDWFARLILLWFAYGFAFLAWLNQLILARPFRELSGMGDFIIPEGSELPPEVLSGEQTLKG